jgi:two-component system, NtrC family, response regulator AtoC
VTRADSLLGLSDFTSTLQAAASPEAGARLSLIAIGPAGVESRPLPESGALTIGRAPENEVALDDPLISRTHARLHLGESLSIEDLSSANGTAVLGRRLSPGERAALRPGQTIEIGAWMLIVQALPATTWSARVQTHARLEARLEDECARASKGRKTELVLLRCHVDGPIERKAIEDVLLGSIRAGDTVASYAPHEYEILLVDTTRENAERLGADLQTTFNAQGAELVFGGASFPRDGLTPGALIQRACAELRDASISGGTMRAGSGASGPIVIDPAMQELYRVLERVAQGTIAVLLIGETGVGKEALAEAVHQRSPRKEGPFVRLNCAAISETLVESELFGHEKGAFTGAEKMKPGLFEVAHRGTLFLDEVGELPMTAQAKLLRVIEQREVQRVGGVKPIPIDVRFVSATNRDLRDEIARGRFREDLFYRLAGVTLVVPPLRERTSEIEPLARMFAEDTSREMGLRPPRIREEALEYLRRYSWPGNIRELRNMIERAVLLATGDQIDPEHLELDKLATAWVDAKDSRAKLTPEDEAERQRIMRAIDRCAGNQTRAAEVLGVSRQTLTKWLTRYAVPRPRKKG